MSRRHAQAAVTALVIAAIAGLIALGVWQLQRRTWKLALIAQTERRLAAAPVPAPGPAQWPAIGRDDAYTRVALTGRYLPNADSFAQAVTNYGSGYWVMTPLDTGRFVVLVNRGFVPADRRGRTPPPGGPVTVFGLLRISEPGGGFLRSNDPTADRWYSRDVAVIAAKRGLARVAPYFIDADADGRGWPRGGLTVVRFPNNHLVYALTWFGMAALLAVMALRARGRHQED